MPSYSAFVKKKQSEDESSRPSLVQLSQLSTPAFSTLLWKNSSHLRIRLTCKCFEDSSAWAWNPLLSRSTRAFVLIAYSRAKPAWSFMRAFIRSIVCPYLCSSDSRQLRQVFTLRRVILHIFRYLWFLGTTCPFNIVTKQGNYSLRRPPKLIIPQAVIEQR